MRKIIFLSLILLLSSKTWAKTDPVLVDSTKYNYIKYLKWNEVNSNYDAVYTNALYLSGYPLASFAIKNSTQTFTGQNTFTKTLTISSNIVISSDLYFDTQGTHKFEIATNVYSYAPFYPLNKIVFPDSSSQSTAYKVMVSSFINIRGNDQTFTGAFKSVVGSTITVVTSGNTRLEISFSLCHSNNTIAQGDFFDILFNGTRIHSTTYGVIVDVQDVAGKAHSATSTIMTNILSAGTHEVSLLCGTSGGNTTIYTNAGGVTPAYICVREIR